MIHSMHLSFQSFMLGRIQLFSNFLFFKTVARTFSFIGLTQAQASLQESHRCAFQLEK